MSALLKMANTDTLFIIFIADVLMSNVQTLMKEPHKYR